MKLCGGAHGCGEERWIEEFRLLSSGSRAAYCRDCERRFDKWRKGRSGEEIPAGLRPDERSGPELIDELLAGAGVPDGLALVFSGDVTIKSLPHDQPGGLAARLDQAAAEEFGEET